MANNLSGKENVSIYRVIFNICIILFFIVSFVVLIISVSIKTSSNNDGSFLGYQLRVVISPSMESSNQTDVSNFKIKSIKTRSMIFIEQVPIDKEDANQWYSRLEVGDVLTFKYVYSKQEVITHRITKIVPKETDGYLIHLMGDNKDENSNSMTQIIDTSKDNSQNYVLGKVVGVSYGLGVVVTSLHKPLGIILMIILPCIAVLIYEIIVIAKLIVGGKRDKLLEIQRQKDLEIEQLKLQMARIQSNENLKE